MTIILIVWILTGSPIIIFSQAYVELLNINKKHEENNLDLYLNHIEIWTNLDHWHILELQMEFTSVR